MMLRRIDTSLLKALFLALLELIIVLLPRILLAKVRKELKRTTTKMLLSRELYGRVIISAKGKYNFREEYTKRLVSEPKIWRYSGTDGTSYRAYEQVDVITSMPDGEVKTDILLAGGKNGSLRNQPWSYISEYRNWNTVVGLSLQKRYFLSTTGSIQWECCIFLIPPRGFHIPVCLCQPMCLCQLVNCHYQLLMNQASVEAFIR
ncbi:uncharacterized protein LOC141684202 isoform X2 [Apium graveolens]|uniref:uncharacterized protein LOC141684202 isoform X2 n=1 Tax=Apium graveolens TaxID=4045 RepID=UPI003D797D32